MKTMVTHLCLLALVAAACAADSSEESSASRDFSTSPDFGKTVERVLARALGVSQPRFEGVGAAITDLFGAIPLTLGKLESVLAVAAPVVAVAGLIIAIIALTKVGALYSKLGLSAYDTVKEAVSLGLPDFGLPGRGYPVEGEYEGPGHYDPTQYPYHEEGHHNAAGESSYTSYASRRSGSADGQQQQQQPLESRVSHRVPAAAPQPASWS